MRQGVNQTPEQAARDRIDDRLRASGWRVQDRDAIDFNAGPGIAVREYPTDTGPADYVLFCDRKPVGVVEAKPDAWGERITTAELQSERYADAELKWVANAEPLPWLYESTGQITRFTNRRDPSPRSREVFAFHRPETFRAWSLASRSLRSGIASLPPLDPTGLRECQVKAIANLEVSLKADRPRALVQMATGSGKTFTAITQVYRLLKHAGAERVLFLVDTRNLGEQAEQEFMAFLPNDDNRKFTELYNVQRLKSPSIAGDAQVVVSTIQRMYATLRGEELPDGAEEEHPEERRWQRPEPLPVVYNDALPPEFFDAVVIDACVTASKPRSRNSFPWVFSLSGRPRRTPRKTSPEPTDRSSASARTSSARLDSGTRCSRLAFMRSAWSVHPRPRRRAARACVVARRRCAAGPRR